MIDEAKMKAALMFASKQTTVRKLRNSLVAVADAITPDVPPADAPHPTSIGVAVAAYPRGTAGR